MDAKTPVHLLKGVDAKDLAIGIQISSQVGQNRSITMTLGVPMIMELSELNQFMDKCASVLDRQNDKGLLEVAKLNLEAARKNLVTNIQQRETYYAQQALDHEVRGRKGSFTPSESQRAQLRNFDSTTANLKETVIPKLMRDIEDLERKINEGV